MIGEFRIVRFGDVASTNDIIRERITAGECSGLVVVAESQNQGRGRLGRSWQSPPGNLYLSILLRPEQPIAAWATLSLVTGLSLAEAIGNAIRSWYQWSRPATISTS